MASKKPKRRTSTLILKALLLLIVVLLVGGVLFLKSDYAARRTCQAVKDGLRSGLGLDATLSRCEIGLLPPSLEIHGIVLDGPDDTKLFSIPKLRIELDSLALLTGSLRLDRVRLTRPEIHLTVADGRVVNLPALPEEEDGPDPEGGSVPLLPERVDVEGARLDLVVEGQALLQLRDIRLSLDTRGRRGVSLLAEVGGGSLDLVGGKGHSFALQTCKLKVSQEDGLVEVDHVSLQLGDLSLDGHGRIRLTDTGPRPEMNLRLTAPLAWLHRILPDVPPMEGKVVLSADTREDAGSVGVQGAMDVKGFGIETARNIDLKTRFGIVGDRLHLTSLSATSPAGSAAGGAELGLAAPWDFKGKLTLDGVDLVEALAMGDVRDPPIELKGKGSVDFHGKFQGKHGPYVILSHRLDIDRLLVRPDREAAPVMDFGPARLRAGAAFTGRRVRFPSFALQTGTSTIEGEGKIYFHDGRVTMAVHAGELELADLSPIQGLPVRGAGSFELGISGAFPMPRIDFEFKADGLTVEDRLVGSVRGDMTIDAAELRLERLLVARRGGVARVKATLGMQAPNPLEGTVVLDGAPLPEVFALVQGGRAPPFLSGELVGELTASGTLHEPVLDFKVGFTDVRIGEQVFEEGGVIGRLDEGAWHFDVVEARMGPGWLFARGTISAQLDLDISVYSTGLRAASFQALHAVLEVLDFRLDLNLVIRGPVRSPSFSGWTKVYDTRLKGRRLPDSFVTARATTESFEVKGRFAGEAAALDARADLQADLPFVADLRFKTKRLGQFLEPLTPGFKSRMTLAGNVHAEGLLLKPGRIHGELRLDRFNVAMDGVKVGNPSPVLLTLKGGEFRVRHFELAGTNTYLVATGGGTLAGGPDLNVRGALGLGLVPLFARFVKRAAGRADFRLHLHGPWLAPKLSGSANVSADTLRFGGFSQDVHALTAEMRFTPQKLAVTKMQGEIGGGKFTGQGTVEMQSFLPTRYALNFDIERVRYNVSRNLWGIGTGVLGVRGEPGKPVLLSGEFRLHEGSFDERIRLVTLDGGLLRRRVETARTYAREREVVALDIRLQIPEKFKVRYNLDLIDFKAEMQGNLRVTGTNERLGLLGEMEALGGKVTYISKDFDVNSARIQFIDETSIHPRVDVLASLTETVDRGDQLDFGKRGGKVDYRISLQLTADGSAKPEITLKSEPFEEERDIIMLLHFGFTTRDVETLKGEDLAGLGGDILFRSLKLDKRISRLFPFPPEVVQPRYLRVRSRLSPGVKGVKAASMSPHVEVGLKLRIISDDLDLDYSRSLYDESSQSLDLTYSLSDTISTRLRWEDAGQQASVGDFGDLGLDLRLQWEW